MPSDDQTSIAREWQERHARCRRMADLVRAREARSRLAALAHEIEKQMSDLSRIVTIAEERKRQSTLLLEAIEQIAGHIRSEMFFTKQLLRRNSYTPEALREEARLCREEAKLSAGSEQHRAFSHRAFELAQFAEAVSRNDRSS